MTSGPPVRTRSAPGRSGSRTESPRYAYRGDIDGLRALAVLLVVVYHVWFGRVSGGVDVFLMLSAFFLTWTALRRIEDGPRVSPLARIVGVFRRLVPAMAVTLIAVLAVVYGVYPATRWPAIWEQTWASVFYVQNWALAGDAVDYYSRSDIPSPLQHFWSLSVQGQAFVLWILILAGCEYVVRRWSLAPARVVASVFGVVFVVSLVYSIVRTATAQDSAYFDTFARLWEFAAGSLLVVLLARLQLSYALRTALVLVGLVGLVATGMVLDVRGGFPGFLALWPVLCAAAVVLGGSGQRATLPSRMLASRGMRRLGADAYALYLVHWPVLVTWMVLKKDAQIGVVDGLAVIVVSLALARMLTAFIDRPVRAWKRDASSLAPAVAVIVVPVLAVTSMVGAWQITVAVHERRSATADVRDNPGAAVLRNPLLAVESSEAPMLPLPTQVHADWVQLDEVCDARLGVEPDERLYGTCFFTPETLSSDTGIVVGGDSHAQQFTAAVLEVAADNGWGVVTLIKGGCALGADEPEDDPVGCGEWRDSVLDYVARLAPAAVMTVVTRADAGDGEEVVRPGMDRTIDRILSAGIDVIGLRDNPRFTFDMFECVQEGDPDACAVARSASLASVNPAEALERDGLHLVDLTDLICPQDICSGAIGNTAVYRDDNHLTTHYSASLAPFLAEQLPLSLG